MTQLPDFLTPAFRRLSLTLVAAMVAVVGGAGCSGEATPPPVVLTVYSDYV